MSRRGDRAECRRCARLPPPSSASPFADAVADAALVRAPPKRRASFALGRSRGVFPLTASALARKALEEGDARDASDSDEDWRSARSAQTTRSSVDDTGDTGVSETAGNLETFETFDEPHRTCGLSGLFAAPYGDARFDTRDPSSRTARIAMEMDASSSVLGRAQPRLLDVRNAKSRKKVSRKTLRRRGVAALERATADFEDDALGSVRGAEEGAWGGGLCWVWWVWKRRRRNDDSRKKTRRRRKRPSSGGARRDAKRETETRLALATK